MCKKLIFFSFFISILLGLQSLANDTITVITPERVATPSSAEKYCGDLLKAALKAPGDSVCLEFKDHLLPVFQEISHGSEHQEEWKRSFLDLVQQVRAKKNLSGLGITAWSPLDNEIISPMIAVVCSGKSQLSQLRLAYICRTSTPDMQRRKNNNAA